MDLPTVLSTCGQVWSKFREPAAFHWFDASSSGVFPKSPNCVCFHPSSFGQLVPVDVDSTSRRGQTLINFETEWEEWIVRVRSTDSSHNSFSISENQISTWLVWFLLVAVAMPQLSRSREFARCTGPLCWLLTTSLATTRRFGPAVLQRFSCVRADVADFARRLAGELEGARCDRCGEVEEHHPVVHRRNTRTPGQLRRGT